MLVQSIRAALRDAADQERAPRMQAYMKSSTPFLGVPVPTVRRLTRNAERAEPPEDEAARERVVRTLWDEARYREERYAATELLNTAGARIGVPAGRLTLRERTDVQLLSFAIEASATETGFFLRKAIGWALRDYARTARSGSAGSWPIGR